VLFAVDTDERLVALTIDDSPHPSLTPRILDVLAKHDARATFFVIGSRIAGNEEILRRLAAEGHELGNHMMEDAPSFRLPATEFARQLAQTHALLAEFGPIRWFRPGHGWFNRTMLVQLREQGYRCALASAYSVEGRFAPVWYVAWHIMQNARPGTVIVLHDGQLERERTVAVLETVLPALQRRGLRVGTLSELNGQEMASDHASARNPSAWARAGSSLASWTNRRT
jgi:peptidoglycan/xylan/chitin deacetylase (PgdA/CDA1 family)